MEDDIFLGEANELLRKVLNNNYDLSNNHEIEPELRDEIESFLKPFEAMKQDLIGS